MKVNDNDDTIIQNNNDESNNDVNETTTTTTATVSTKTISNDGANEMMNDTIKTTDTTTTTTINTTGTTTNVIMTCNNYPIYFQDDWTAGIGGGLWCTGIALAKYFGALTVPTTSEPTTINTNTNTNHTNNELLCDSAKLTLCNIESLYNYKKRKLNVLELGSGNGVLAICFAALVGSKYINKLVITDIEDHIQLIEQTIQCNQHIVSLCTNDSNDNDNKSNNSSSSSSSTCVPTYVIEHRWGEFETKNADDANPTPTVSTSTDDTTDNTNNDYSTLIEQMKYGTIQYDIIIGSDIAYGDESITYKQLLKSLQQLSFVETTICIIGITMMDTKTSFFTMLTQSGFQYDRIPDYYIDSNYHGTSFGIFIITKIK